MRSEPILEAMRQQPFKPFLLKTAGGREYRVPHPEMIATHPRGRYVSLMDDRGVPVMLDLTMVESLNYLENDEKGAA